MKVCPRCGSCDPYWKGMIFVLRGMHSGENCEFEKSTCHHAFHGGPTGWWRTFEAEEPTGIGKMFGEEYWQLLASGGVGL